MMPSPSHTGARTIATVDLSPFTEKFRHSFQDSERLKAGRALVEACHSLGFVKITGHGVTKQEIDEAFAWTKRLFDLPYAEKMKAPHPAGNMPHRGYSGLGQEKVYSKADMENHAANGNIGKEIRKISDFKVINLQKQPHKEASYIWVLTRSQESYEIGSEYDDQQQNIWLPDDVLPQFRSYMTSLYERLAGVGTAVLGAIGVGLGLDAEAHAALMQLLSERHSQLRLLHYPAISKEKLQNELFARLPSHTDWG
jgi:isopenicillin N synthase-like dioxygenase